eukprot:7218537-Alexandrium_andersonii.AAC.1
MNASTDTQQWATEIQRQFRRKWACDRLDDRFHALEFVMAQDGAGSQFAAEHYNENAVKARRPCKCDAYGVSVA